MAGEAASGTATGTDGTPATGDEGNKTVTPDTKPATGAAGQPATGAAPTTPSLTPEQVAEMLASNARMEAALKSANKEAENLRKKEKERADADKSAEEKAAEELAALQTEKEAWQVERAGFSILQQVNRQAGPLGLVDAEVVYSLLDWDNIDFDDKGNPDLGSVDKAITAIVAAKPFLAGKAGPNPGARTGNNAGDGTGGSNNPPNLTQEELAAAKSSGITPERFAALKNVRTLDDWQATRRTGGQGS